MCHCNYMIKRSFLSLDCILYLIINFFSYNHQSKQEKYIASRVIKIKRKIINRSKSHFFLVQASNILSIVSTVHFLNLFLVDNFRLYFLYVSYIQLPVKVATSFFAHISCTCIIPVVNGI